MARWLPSLVISLLQALHQAKCDAAAEGGPPCGPADLHCALQLASVYGLKSEVLSFLGRSVRRLSARDTERCAAVY